MSRKPPTPPHPSIASHLQRNAPVLLGRIGNVEVWRKPDGVHIVQSQGIKNHIAVEAHMRLSETQACALRGFLMPPEGQE